MKFGFIAYKPQKSFAALAEQATTRGHTVEHIPLDDLPVAAAGIRAFVEDCASTYDALHYYAGLADPIGIEFGRICDELQIPLLNNRAHIAQLVHNKMLQALAFSRADLPIPKTEFSPRPVWDTLAAKLGTPIVAKRVRGTQGRHVRIVTNQVELDELKGAAEHIFQEYLPHKNDVRVLVLDGVAVCGYRRVPNVGEFRANLALGGHAEPLADAAEQATTFALAEAAVAALPHDLAGVDIIRSESDGQYRLIEINTNPSWYGLQAVTDVSFTDCLLDRYEAMAHTKAV